MNARYEEEITHLRNGLAYAKLHEQTVFEPSFDEIRATPPAMKAEEPAGTMKEEEEEHQ